MIHTLVLPNFPIKKKKKKKKNSPKLKVKEKKIQNTKNKKQKRNRLNFVCISFVPTSRLLIKQCLHPKTPSQLSSFFSLVLFFPFIFYQILGFFFFLPLLVCNLIINLDSFAYLIRILLSKFCFNL